MMDMTLPSLHVSPVWVEYDYVPEDQLVFTNLGGIAGHRAVRKATTEVRCQTAAELVNAKQRAMDCMGRAKQRILDNG